MLKVILHGNIGQDAEVRQVNGMAVISFSVAHSEKWKDQQGQVQERTTWVRCSMWRKPESTAIAQYLRKGQKVLVEGTPSASAWLGNDGNANASLECKVLNLELSGSAQPAPSGYQPQTQPQSQYQQQQQHQAPAPLQSKPQGVGAMPMPEEDDLPF